MTDARSELRRIAALVALSTLAACGSTTSAPRDAPSSAIVAPSASAMASASTSSALRWGSSTVTFASIGEGRGVLGAEDDFTRALGALDRQLRLGRTTPVGDGAFRAHAAAQVLAWPDADRARWEKAALELGEALRGLTLPLPAEILIVQTTGKDELDAAYTRGAAIVLPAREVAASKSPLTLLAHELFHVATRHDPGLRRRLFPLIGFQPVDRIAIPKALEATRLTNPDAFVHDFAIEVKERKGTRTFLAVPLLYCALPLADAIERGLGESIGISLLELDDAGKAVRGEDGEPILHEVGSTDFMQLASINTAYAIHAEEVLADNFAIAMGERASGSTREVANRAVLDAILAALK